MRDDRGIPEGELTPQRSGRGGVWSGGGKVAGAVTLDLASENDGGGLGVAAFSGAAANAAPLLLPASVYESIKKDLDTSTCNSRGGAKEEVIEDPEAQSCSDILSESTHNTEC